MTFKVCGFSFKSYKANKKAPIGSGLLSGGERGILLYNM